MNRRSAIFGGAAIAVGSFGARRSPHALSGDSFLLGGAEVRLADIIAPAAGAPHADEARETLQRLMARGIAVMAQASQPDRWARMAARANAGDIGRTSFQRLLVEAGAARVRPESDDLGFIASLLATESAARAARRGLWRLRAYAVRSAEDARSAIGGFHLVEGAVADAAVNGARAYLNFGADFRTDFTASAASRDAKRWTKLELDMIGLKGTHVRIRGYTTWIGGPAIEILHPMQIEAIATPALDIWAPYRASR